MLWTKNNIGCHKAIHSPSLRSVGLKPYATERSEHISLAVSAII
jgi:hypothetical protein